MIERGPVTALLIDALKTSNLPVGDNNAPQDPYGWQSDEPNAEGSNFIPWMSITAGPGKAQTRPGSVGDSNSEWLMSYSVFYTGVTRDQCDWLADKMRGLLTEIKKVSVNGWRIQQVKCPNIGGTNRISSPFPDYYTQADSFEVWLSKER